MGPKKKKKVELYDDLTDEEEDALLDAADPSKQIHGDGGNLELWDDGEEQDSIA